VGYVRHVSGVYHVYGVRWNSLECFRVCLKVNNMRNISEWKSIIASDGTDDTSIISEFFLILFLWIVSSILFLVLFVSAIICILFAVKVIF
jgi:hypothetical protein